MQTRTYAQALRALGIAVTAGTFAACSGEPTRPNETASRDEGIRGLTSADRHPTVKAAVLFARDHAARAFENDAARAELDRWLDLLSEGVNSRTPHGIEDVVRHTRARLDRYRETLGPGSERLPDLEVLALMLDGIELAMAGGRVP